MIGDIRAIQSKEFSFVNNRAKMIDSLVDIVEMLTIASIDF